MGGWGQQPPQRPYGTQPAWLAAQEQTHAETERQRERETERERQQRSPPGPPPLPGQAWGDRERRGSASGWDVGAAHPQAAPRYGGRNSGVGGGGGGGGEWQRNPPQRHQPVYQQTGTATAREPWQEDPLAGRGTSRASKSVDLEAIMRGIVGDLSSVGQREVLDAVEALRKVSPDRHSPLPLPFAHTEQISRCGTRMARSTGLSRRCRLPWRAAARWRS